MTPTVPATGPTATVSEVGDLGREAIPLSIPVVAGNEWAYVKECLDAGFLAAGPMLGRFESALRDLTGARHAVACASGTAALHTALLVAGVRPGDTVLVPTITFAATVGTSTTSPGRTPATSSAV